MRIGGLPGSGRAARVFYSLFAAIRAGLMAFLNFMIFKAMGDRQGEAQWRRPKNADLSGAGKNP